MKALSVFLLAGLALTPVISAQAVELNDSFELIITPALTTDYRASGLSQTLGDPAAQLAVTLSHASGLYAGVWTSNVNFGYGSKTRQEIEYFGATSGRSTTTSAWTLTTPGTNSPAKATTTRATSRLCWMSTAFCSAANTSRT